MMIKGDYSEWVPGMGGRAIYSMKRDSNYRSQFAHAIKIASRLHPAEMKLYS